MFGRQRENPLGGNGLGTGELSGVRHPVALVAALCVGVTLPVAAQDTFSGKVTRIERGDQVVVQLEGWSLTVRLHGAQTPASPPFSEIALEWSQARLKNQKVTVHVRGTAAKGVVYGDIAVGEKKTDLSKELLEQGMATWASSYAPGREDLAAAERVAHQAKRGIWGEPRSETSRLLKLLPVSASAPTPLPVKPAAPQPKSNPPWPLALGILGAGGLLFAAERVGRDARRLRERPVLFTDAKDKTHPIKAKGTVRPQDGHTLTSIAGHIPALYLRERTETFREGAWQIVHDEVNALPFLLDDGLEQALVPVEKTVYKPIRVARFYNDIPVENWHARAYSGDVRTQILFIPPDVTVTVYGAYRSDPARFEPGTTKDTQIRVIEGDERRLSRRPLQLATGLIAAAVVVLILGLWLTVSGAK